MSRIIAIDYGSKRVGLAVADPLKIFAFPLETVHSKDVIEFLKSYEAKEGIECFVIGMPKTVSNEDSDNARLVRIFIQLLQKNFPGKAIHEIDERFTSSIALDAMIRGGMKKKDRQVKGNVDKISAAIILQSYLEQHKG